MGDVFPVQEHLAFRCRGQSGDSVSDLSLTVAGNTCDGKDLSRMNGKGYLLHNREVVFIEHGEILYFQHLFSEMRLALVTVEVHLTQAETGKFWYGEEVAVQVNWLASGERYATEIANVRWNENLIKEVME